MNERRTSSPVCNEKVFVELPDGRVVRLKKWLYGMRKAASSWEEFYTEKFVEKGFQPGSSCPVVFFNKETAVRVVVHGDDFTFSGDHRELVALRKWMESWCDIKFRGIMGSGRDDTKEIEILGRTLRRTRRQKTGVSAPNAEGQSFCSFSCSSPLWVN